MPLLSFELPDINPQPQPSPVSRYSWSWPVVSVVFFLLVGLQLVAYFSQGNADPAGAQKLAEQLRLYTKQKSIASSSTAEKSVRAGLEKLTAAVRKEKKESDTVLGECRLLVVAGHEFDGRKPDPTALKFLKDSKDDRNRAFATLYGDAPGNWKSADIAKRIGERNFVSKLAQVHAYELQGDKEARSRILGDPDQTKLFLSLLLLGLLAAAGVSLVLWIYFLSRSRNGKLPPRGFSMSPSDAGEADSIGVRVLLYLCSFLFIPPLLSFAADSFVKEDTRTGLLISIASMGIVLIALVVILNLKLGRYSLGVKRILGLELPFGKLLGYGVIGACMNLIPFFVGAMISSFLMLFLPEANHPASQIIQSDPGTIEVLLIMVTACVFAPILEEIVFRGMIGPALAKKLKSPAAGILVSAALFASIHPQGIAGWPPLFALGAMFGLVSYYTKSLVPGMVMHAINNFIVLLAGLYMS